MNSEPSRSFAWSAIRCSTLATIFSLILNSIPIRASERPTLSLEEIWRPLTNPKGMMQITTPSGEIMGYSGYGFTTEQLKMSFIWPLFPLPPSYSFTDRYAWPYVAWPFYMRYAVVQKMKLKAKTHYLTGPSLAVEGSLSRLDLSFGRLNAKLCRRPYL